MGANMPNPILQLLERLPPEILITKFNPASKKAVRFSAICDLVKWAFLSSSLRNFRTRKSFSRNLKYFEGKGLFMMGLSRPLWDLFSFSLYSVRLQLINFTMVLNDVMKEEGVRSIHHSLTHSWRKSDALRGPVSSHSEQKKAGACQDLNPACTDRMVTLHILHHNHCPQWKICFSGRVGLIILRLWVRIQPGAELFPSFLP